MTRSLLLPLLVAFTAIASAQAPVWVKSVGAPGLQLGDRSAVDAAGNLYVTGRFSGTNVDFDPSPTGTFLLSASGTTDGYVAKYAPNGNFVWAFRLGGSDRDEINDIALDHSGHFVLSGYFRGSADFNPGAGTATLTSNGDAGADPGYGGDMFVAKYDVNGNYIWAFGIGGSTLYDNAVGIAIDNADNVIIGGYFRETPDFDPGAGTAIRDGANGTAFVAKYNSGGQYQWAFNFGQGFVDNTVFDVQTDAANNVYFSGFFQGTGIDMDPGPGVQTISSAGSADIMVGKFTPAGAYTWVKTAGGGGWDVSYHLEVDGSGNVYHTGVYASSSADFDPGAGSATLASNGLNDIYLAKWNASGAYQWVVPIGGPLSGTEYGNSISIDGQGNVIVAGSFEGTVDLDPGAATANIVSAGASDGFFAKYTSAGAYLCGGRVGGSSTEIVYDIISFGTDFYLVGFFASPNTDMDPGAGTLLFPSAGSEDIFIGRYSWSAQTAAGTLSGNSVCTGGTGQLTFNATAGTGPFTLTISNGSTTVTYNNITSGTPFTPNPAPTTTTTYTLTSIKDANTCSGVVPASGTATVTINTVNANATVSGAICRGDSAQLTASGGTTYAWSPATGLSATNIANPKASPAATTTYTVTITGAGGCTATRTVTVTVNALPVVTLSAANPVICQGESTQLTATGGGTYAFTPATSLSNAAIANPTATPAATTSYQVQVTSAQGCRQTAQTTVTVNTRPLVSLGPDSLICGGGSIVLNATTAGATGYTWSNGATTPTISVNGPGNYSVAVQVPGCATPSRDTVLVTTGTLPTVTLGADRQICTSDNLALTFQGTGYTSFVWSTGSTASSITVNTTGDYWVRVQNGCGSSADTLRVQADKCDEDIYFPSAFTPNHDGKNDGFKALHAPGVTTAYYQLTIYNRWGNRVFRTNYLEAAWGGTIEGERQGINTFVYYAEYRRTPGGPLIKKNGTFVMIR
ncbi:MAG: T9SS type B sorting domain-containing protein [Chitinophagaceae bacterium]|nr:MAG: T9SS type B sorting domain-containing protein [Chitinophagaceae bacterium]